MPAIGAKAIELKEVTGDTKAETRFELAFHAVGDALLEVKDTSTLRADKMMLATIRTDIGWSAIADIDRAHDTKIGE